MENKGLKVLRSPMFWAALAGLMVVTGRSLDPTFPLDEQQMTSLLVLLASFVLAEGIEGNPGAPLLRARLMQALRSRKFWAALAGVTLVVLQIVLPEAGEGVQELNRAVYLLAAYILGIGITDARRGQHADG